MKNQNWPFLQNYPDLVVKLGCNQRLFSDITQRGTEHLIREYHTYVFSKR